MLNLKKMVIAEASQWENKNTIAYINLAKVFANVDSKDWYIWYAKAHLSSLIDVWRQIPIEQWKNDVMECLNTADQNQINYIVNQINDEKLQGEWRYKYFKLCVMEREITTIAKRTSDMTVCEDVLKQYVDKVLDFYGDYYVEEAFVYFREVLPKSVQDAMKSIEMMDEIGVDRIEKKCTNIQEMSMAEWMDYIDEQNRQGILALERLRVHVEEVFPSNDLRYLYLKNVMVIN